MRGAVALEIPIVCTEQYPKALGQTVEELLDVMPEACKRVSKTDFTMLGESNAAPRAEASVVILAITERQQVSCSGTGAPSKRSRSPPKESDVSCALTSH